MKRLLLSLAACLGLGFAANATTVTFNFESNDYGMPNDGDTYVTVPQTITEGDVTITLNGDENSWRMWSDGLRVYYKKNPTLTITSTGEKINSISWKVKSGVKFAETADGAAITSWTGDAESVTLYGGVGTGNAALQTLTIVCGEEIGGGGDEPSTPTGTITVAEALQLISDGYTGTAKVKGIISNIAEVSTQYGNATYTIVDELGANEIALKIFRGKWLNGESFTASNQIAIGGTVEVEGNLSVYNGEAQMAQNNVILSYEAPEGGDTPEQPETPEGTITVAKAMELIGSGYTGTATVEGYISEIEEVSTQYGNATYTIVDELGTDQLGLLIYRGYWTNGDKFTEGNEIAVGGKVVVEGSLVNYNDTYEMTTGSKILSYVAPEGGDTPEPDQPGEPGEGTTFNVNEARNIVGTFVEEQLKDDGSVQAAAHYQPLESLYIDDYFFAFASNNENASSQPAYYYATSTNANQQATIRLYNGSSMSITAPEDKTLAKIEFKGSNLGKDANFTANTGSFVLNGNNGTWTGSANSMTLNVNATWRISEVTVYLTTSSAVEGIEAADNSEVVYYNLQGVKVNNPAKGQLVIVRQGNKTYKTFAK